ncbi:MAG: hypothetical protein IT385_23705 [Deltaproteobacteria bacterium]|nr:hypothetical protein [Deltaproteobacteria bacterium]
MRGTGSFVFVVSVVACAMGAGCSSTGVQFAEDLGLPIRNAPGVDYIERAQDADRGVVAFARAPAGKPEGRLGADGPIHAHVSMKVPLKFWAQKTCEQVTCNYDHGEMMLTLYVDRAEVATVRALFYERDWEAVHPTALLSFTPGDASPSSRTAGRFEEELARALERLGPGAHEVAISVWKLGRPSEAFVAGAVLVDVP